MESEPAFLRLFSELSALGAFRLTRNEKGEWHSSVEFPSPEGVTAQCRSDFNHKTPVEAMQCLHDRLGGLRSMVNIAAPVPGVAHLTVAK